MASRRFFPYDNHYYTSPYNYSYPYYRTAPARDDGAIFFPDVESVQPAVRRSPYDSFFPDVESVQPAVHPSPFAYHHQPSPARAPEDSPFFPGVQVREPSSRVLKPNSSRSRSVSVPVHFAGSESELEPEREAARLHVLAADRMAHAAGNKKREQSAAEAAVRVQAAARGFMVRRMVREVRAVEREAEGIATRMEAEAEALRGDARARVGIGEELMRLLLRLDAVHGVREYRRRVTKRVLALQDAVDALERPPAPVTDTPAAAEALEAEIVEMAEGNQAAEESEMAPELPNAAEQDVDIAAEIEAEPPAATETAAQMEVDEGGATGDEAGDPDETELVAHGEKGQEAEGEWEMVTGEDAVARENSAPEAQQQAPAAEEEEKKTQGGAHAADGLDTKKVLEMVAALCEQSAQQCAVIGALAERVDTLERAVRRVEEADRRRRRKKKLKEGKGSSKAARSCYSD